MLLRNLFAAVAVQAFFLKGADRNGRVNLINPKKTMELAGIKL